MATPLFTVPIPPCDAPKHPGGAIVCTEPRPAVYLLTFTSPADNRMTTAFCRAMMAALDIIEFGYPPGVVVTTSGIAKFYSNGLDLEHAVATEGYWATLFGLWKRFLSYPMPTVALINGHAFAGGLMFAMIHDYRLAPTPRGFLCVNELLFGAPLPPAMAALFRHKLPAATYRTMVLEARRYAAEEALAAGIVDGIAPAGLDDALAFIEARGLVDKPKSGVYGVLKAEMHKDLIWYMHGAGLDAEEARFQAAQAAEGERKEFGKVWYEQWQKENKAKL